MGLDESLASDLHNTTTFYDGRFNAQTVTIIVCCSLALYSAFVLLLLVFTTFRRYKGLYFWSLLVASSGIIPYTVGFLCEYFQLTVQLAGLIITSYGWPAMVTGQSLVLYSRLGVVLGRGYDRLRKGVLWMIIVDGIVFHVTTTVVLFGAYLVPPPYQFPIAYRYIEKIQMTGFTLQEFIISGLYVWRTLEILKTTGSDRKRTRRVMWQLFAISVIIIFADIALLVVEYQNRHVIEQALKAAVYGIKLKLEFAILSKLVGITRHDQSTFLGTFADYDEVQPERIRARDKARSLDSGSGSGKCPNCSKIDIEKGEMLHIERSSSIKGSLDPIVHDSAIVHGTSFGQSPPAHTADQQRRRRTLDEDEYAGFCRDVAG